MFLSLIMALLTYLLSPRGTSKERKQALLNAALVGGTTYAVSEYTDWGKENLGPINDSIGKAITGKPTSAAVAGAGAVAPSAATQTAAGAGTLLSAVNAMGPAGAATVGFGLGAVSKPGNLKWLLVIGAGIVLLSN